MLEDIDIGDFVRINNDLPGAYNWGEVFGVPSIGIFLGVPFSSFLKGEKPRDGAVWFSDYNLGHNADGLLPAFRENSKEALLRSGLRWFSRGALWIPLVQLIPAFPEDKDNKKEEEWE